MTYMVCDANGNALTDGLQDHDAHRVAQRMANSRGESVWLSKHGSDDMGEEIAAEVTADDLVLVRSDAGNARRAQGAAVND